MLLSISNLNSSFDDFLPFLLLWLCWDHSVTLYVFLDDLVDCWPGDTYSFSNVSDWHSNRFQVSIFPESQFNDLDFHGELYLRSMLQELMQVFDWQVYYFWILFLQNLVIRVLLHLPMELFSFLLDWLDHLNLGFYVFVKVLFSYILISVFLFINNTYSSTSLGIKSLRPSGWRLTIFCK